MTLKDETSSLKAIMFKSYADNSKFIPTDGSKVKGTIKIKVIGKKVEQISNDVKDDTNKDTNKSPETGLTSITTALLITMLLSVIAYVVFKKKNLFKRV